MKPSILVIEDDKLLGRLLAEHLSNMGFNAMRAQSWREAMEVMNKRSFKLVLLDVELPDARGDDMLPKLVNEQPVILITAYGSVKGAVNAMKAGAAEYLVKPVNLDELEITVKRVLEEATREQDLHFCQRRLSSKARNAMVGNSAALQQAADMIEAVAPTDMTVLIHGESGVGKELVAQAIHRNSERSARNFAAVDCCTLQETLFESELFGHEKGAFTNAVRQKRGLIEIAEGGTLFLDEIGEIGSAIQAKLLRVLDTGQFRRLGSTRDLDSNVRIVAATNRSLEQMCEEGTFREDLYYRLSPFVLEVPPLRERSEDIPALIEYFIQNHDFSRRINKSVSDAAMAQLTGYGWPGNIRELRNVIERAIILSRDGDLITPEHLAFRPVTHSTAGQANVQLSFDSEPTLEEIERAYLAMMLERYQGHRSSIARALGISERNIYRILDRHAMK